MEKFIRFMASAEFLRKIIIFLLLLILGLSFFFTAKMAEKQIERAKAEKALVEKIGAMQKAVEQKTGSPFAPGETPAPYVLEGVMTDYVLINGKVYRDGSILDEYVIWDIQPNAVTLRNKKTKLKKILYLKGSVTPLPQNNP